jgi:hypothetical protein
LVVGFTELEPCLSLDCNFGINSIKPAVESAVAWPDCGASAKVVSELICWFAWCFSCSHFSIVGLLDKSNLCLLLKAYTVRYSRTSQAIFMTISRPLSEGFAQGAIQVHLDWSK